MLSIIYVNYKASNDILASLASIVNYEIDYCNYEFIIVDNSSEDDNLDTIKKNYPFVKIIYAPKNGGFAYGNNIGIQNSHGDTILLLNPDTLIHDNSIQILLKKIQEDTNLHIIGPQLLFVDGTSQTNIVPKKYLTLWALFCEQFYLQRIFKKSRLFNSYIKNYLDPNKECFVKSISGAAFMFKRDIIDTIGLMDEKFFLYFEETDFCFRANKHNIKMLYYPKSKITHAIGLSGKPSSSNMIQHYILSFKLYFKKNFNNPKLIIALLILFLGSFIRFIFYKIYDDKKSNIYFYYLKNITKKSGLVI